VQKLPEDLKITAVLSSTILTEGTFKCIECEMPESLYGVPSYVGHPDTASLLSKLGVISMPKWLLFNGLRMGECYLAVPLANPDRSTGWTVDQAVKDIKELKVKLVTRIA
jgi:hypothetical protein